MASPGRFFAKNEDRRPAHSGGFAEELSREAFQLGDTTRGRAPYIARNVHAATQVPRVTEGLHGNEHEGLTSQSTGSLR